MPSPRRLTVLDAFLRDIWLECCSHLSGFTIAGQSYVSHVSNDFVPFGGMPDKAMTARLDRVLQPGMTFRYEYDYGSTTELNLKVIGPRLVAPRRPAVELLARNQPPEIICVACNSRPATTVCSQCYYSGDGWLCETCAGKHDCDPEMFLPVVNSPRTGVCAYGV